MSDRLIDVRTPLAVSKHARVEVGADGVMHVLLSGVTLHLERALCEELATTLARAVVELSRQSKRPQQRPRLALVQRGEAPAEARHPGGLPAGDPFSK